MENKSNNRHEEKAEISESKKLELIQDLLLGEGSDLFREFEQHFSKFCPFEAIGMVRQEIRHAHFLSFILDPNRPHPFQDKLLKAFLQEITRNSHIDQFDLEPLTIHCSDLNRATVYREKSNIDFLIEIPAFSQGPGPNGIVITVELKIGADESAHQLGKYFHQITEEYPKNEWMHAFVFLTLDGTQPSEENLPNWIPINLVDLIDRFEIEIGAEELTGEAVNLFWNYASMIRRNLVHNNELSVIAKNIWAKHKEALESLYEYRPDLQSEIFGWLENHTSDLVELVHKSTGFTIDQDTSSARVLRFNIRAWRELDGYCSEQKSWVVSGSLLVLELTDWGNGRIRFSYILGPGEDTTRSKVYEEVLNLVDKGKLKISRRTPLPKKWKHFSATDVQSSKDYSKAEENDIEIDVLGHRIFKKMEAFLKLNLHQYDEILRKVLTAKE